MRAMPTFVAYNKGEKVKDLTGAQPAKLAVSAFVGPGAYDALTS